MKRMGKILVMALVLAAFASTAFSAVKDLNWYKKTKMSFDVGAGYVGGGLGTVAAFDYTLMSWSWGFGPINLKVGGLVNLGWSFAYAVVGGAGVNFAVGPVVSVDWALGSVVPNINFLNQLSFYWGIGIGYFYDSYLANVSSTLAAVGYNYGYVPICFLNKIGVKWHFSDTMALVLQETTAWYWNTTVGIEFKF